MWRIGLRISEALNLEWRDLNYLGALRTLIIRQSKTRKARTVRVRAELVLLFTNWPASRAPRDKVIPLAMRTAMRRITEAVEMAGLGEESQGGTGKSRAGPHSLRHSAARHWLVAGRVPRNVVSQWPRHANVQVTLRTHLPIVGTDYSMGDVP